MAKKSSNPLAKKEGKAKKLPKVEQEELAETGEDTFGGGEAGHPEEEDDSFDEAPKAPAKGKGKGKPKTTAASPSAAPSADLPDTGTVAIKGSKAALKTFTVEGEYSMADGKNLKVLRYREMFVLSAEYSDAQARSLIKKLLLGARLKEVKEGYKRFRTHQITQVAPATKEEIQKYGLGHANIEKMNIMELAMYCALHELDVIPSRFSSVEEARLRVQEAKKSGKKVAVIPKDTPKKAPLPGQVDRNNNPLPGVADDGLDA